MVTCWERTDLLALLWLCFVTFPYSVRYLIVSIPDLCLLTFSNNLRTHSTNIMRMDDTCCEYVVQKLFYAWHSHPMSAYILITGPGGYKTFSCSTQLSTKFQLLIKAKIPTNEEVSCFKSLRCCIYHAHKY